MRILSIILLVLVCTNDLQAQPAVMPKSKFFLMPQVGIIKGDNYNATQVGITAGINRKSWSLGLGSAVDYYQVRTIPVFVDIRKKMNNKKLSLFSYMDIGCDLPYPTDANYWISNGYWSTHFDGTRFNCGFYSDLGLGYAWLNKRDRGLVLSVGYSIKTITRRYPYLTTSPTGGSVTEEDKQNFYFNRLLLKAGFRL